MLVVKDLKTKFQVGQNSVSAVDGVSFEVPEGKIVGLVGESGSGKSVSALSIMNLLPPNGTISSGQILWRGKNILDMKKAEMGALRGSEIGLIFQNPLSSLNPVFTVGNQMVETIMLHQKVDKVEAEKIAIALLRKVNIADPEARIKDYPHQFSLGMCQRIMIAITLAMNPKLLIADEPTASLDVTIQAQILELLLKIKDDFKMSILLISHDLGVIAQYCDHIMVMYLGRIVESGDPTHIFKNPLHPYTKALISSIPVPDPTVKMKPQILHGEVPSPLNVPKGCSFHPRCPEVFDRCRTSAPCLEKVEKGQVACWLYDKAKK
jgi:peptide/nickel transport system ATP-binding protein